MTDEDGERRESGRRKDMRDGGQGVERMQDNLLYVGPTHPLAPTVAALQARLTTLHATLSELQLKYVVSANRR